MSDSTTRTLDEFVTAIGAGLDELGIPGPRPDRRTVRYYATAGLVDRPRLAGREARYDEHQLWQVLALKRLQAEGVRLGAIADRLAGRDTAALTALARGDGIPAAGPPVATDPHPGPDGTSQLPAAVTQVRIPLAPGVALVVDRDGTTDPINPTEAAALTRAAAPLLTLLTSLGLRKDPR
ncbi:MerR family transcriptional regulator [Granulicoccus phenolivorans]|uniref:MerR family transcriptional regulator n=1 Tax=Granulicoccus phenolivorans TaxID=266854 RepID=UPI0004165796|nr:MerR family transcriptional regulator [Granulicoccus phenolivorans]